MASRARLRYASDDDPGYRRLGRGKRVRYVDDQERPVRDREELDRIAALAVPPAWTEVWINADPNGHLQAVGRDARGRKQYRYHPEWRRRRDDDKFERVLAFGRRLPRIREAVERDLARQGLPRDKVLALITRLLELTHMRVGGEEYRRLDHTYGLTTLHDRHASVRGSSIRFHYRGKGGRLNDIGIRDRRVARLVRRIQELPGQRLFEYTDDDGKLRPVTSDDVNAYLREISGGDFSAKDFRTWAGTLLAFRYLRADSPPEGVAAQKRQARRAIERVADQLGNTVAVARSSYVDPVLLPAWSDGELQRLRIPATGRAEGSEPSTLEEEAALLRVLARHR